MKKIFYLLILTSFFIACNTGEKKENVLNNSPKYNIKVDSFINKDIRLDDIISDYKLIKLETTDKSLIGNVDKILFYNDKIIILSNGVFCFSRSGNFLGTYGSKGRGPNEYIRIGDICIDNNILYVLDDIQHRILSFDIDTRENISSFTLPYGIKRMQITNGNVISDRLYLIPTKKPGRIVVFNLNNPEDYKTYLSDKSLQTARNEFYGYGPGFVTLTDHLRNDVYRVDGEKCEKYLHLDFGQLALTDKEIAYSIDNDFSLDAIENRETARLFNFYELSNFFVAEIGINRTPHLFLYDKRSKKHFVINENNFGYDISHFFPPINGIYRDMLVGVVYADEVHNRKLNLEKYNIPVAEKSDLNYKNDSIIRTINNGDNPIIVTWKFKHIK